MRARRHERRAGVQASTSGVRPTSLSRRVSIGRRRDGADDRRSRSVRSIEAAGYARPRLPTAGTRWRRSGNRSGSLCAAVALRQSDVPGVGSWAVDPEECRRSDAGRPSSSPRWNGPHTNRTASCRRVEQAPSCVSPEGKRRGSVVLPAVLVGHRVATSRASRSPAVACPFSKLNQPATRIFIGPASRRRATADGTSRGGASGSRAVRARDRSAAKRSGRPKNAAAST